MITSNDLFDLYYSLLLIRDNIKYELNAQILKNISDTMISNCDSENNIRKALSKIDNIDSKKWSFVFFNNVYTFRRLINDKQTLSFLSKMCIDLSDLILECRWEQAYELVDTIHSVPLLIEKDIDFSSKKIDKIMKKYRKKWKMKSALF